jgi:hypothetical protein
MSESSIHEEIELQEIPYGPSPLIRVLRQAALLMGLDDAGSISGAMRPQAYKVEKIFEAMCSSSAWLPAPQHWQYTTANGGSMISDSQLALGWKTGLLRDGTPGIQSNCAFYAKFFQMLLGAAGIEDTDLEQAKKPDHIFITHRLGQAHEGVTGAFRCFDAGITGNVRRQHNTFAVEGRCCFTGHVGVRVGNRVYDPTLQAVYSNGIEDCIDSWFIPDPLRDDIWISKDDPYPDQRTLTRLPLEQAAGFGASYLLS